MQHSARRWVTLAMGLIEVSVYLWHEDANEAQELVEAVFAEARRIDELMSTYKEDSRISELNRDAASGPVNAGCELAGLIERALDIAVLTRGAFDITFDSVGQHYDFRERERPDAATIEREIESIDYRLVKVDKLACSVHFLRAGVRINLGGIAKGYAVDSGIRILQNCGIKQALISAGGDSRIIGDHKGRPWMTGVRAPRGRDKKESVLVIPLSDTAVSTSGDYERYFILDGERYHHIISPKTGKSAKGAQSVTVLGPDTVTTDGLSTTLFVLGVKQGLALAEKLDGIDAVIIDANGKIHYSSGLMPPTTTK